MLAGEFNDVVAFINKEMSRRSKPIIAENVNAGSAAIIKDCNDLISELASMGKTGLPNVSVGGVTNASLVQQMISKAKELYNQNLQP